MSYDRRRLRRHELIERLADTPRYRITDSGARAALLYSRLLIFQTRFFVLKSCKGMYELAPSGTLTRLSSAPR